MKKSSMRFHPPFALAALASFAAGFGGVRWMERATPAVEPTTKAPLAFAKPEPAAEKVDDSPAAAKARIDAVFGVAIQRAGFLRDHSLNAALLKMDAADFLAAASDAKALAERMQKGGLSDDARAAFAEAYLQRWLEVDAPAALRFLGSSPFLAKLMEREKGKGAEQNWSAVQGAAYRALARYDAQWTRDYLVAQPPGPVRDSGIFALLDSVARLDPAKARQFLASFADGVNRAAAVQGYVMGLASADPRAGFAAASAEPAGPIRTTLIETAMREAGKLGVTFVRELLDRIDDPDLRRRVAQESLESIRRCSTNDPLPWIMEETTRGKSPMEGWWADKWGKSIAAAVQGPKLGEAAEWAAALGNDPPRNIFGKIVKEWEQRDANALREWLAESASTLDAGAIHNIGKHLRDMAQIDSGTMQTWADSLPAGRLREEAQYQVALGAGSAGDLARAAAAYQSVSTLDKDGSLARQLTALLATQDGAGAAEWAMQLPEGAPRKAAIEKVAEKWSELDPRGAAEWLGRLPAGKERDAAVLQYATKAVYADPAAAAEWVLQIADPKVRTDAASTVFHQWSWENPAGARAWFRSLPGVDDAKRKDLLRYYR